MTERITETEVYEFLQDEWNETSDWMKDVFEGRTMHFPVSVMKAKRKKLRVIEHITKKLVGF